MDAQADRFVLKFIHSGIYPAQQIIMNKTIQFQGKRISYETAGEGNAIVLLHGFIESARIWEDFTHKLSAEFRVIAVDLPGHGKTEVISEVHSMELMAEVVNAVLVQERVEVAVMVGHSMGGYTVLAFGEKYPGKVISLVLFHSQAAPDSEEVKKNRERTIRIVEQNRAGFIKQFIPDLFAPQRLATFKDYIRFLEGEASLMSPQGIIAAISGMRERKGGLEYLRSATHPFLFIAGKQDPRISCKLLLEQAEIPSHSEVLLLEHVGHMGYIEAPAVTLEAISSFAARSYRIGQITNPVI